MRQWAEIVFFCPGLSFSEPPLNGHFAINNGTFFIWRVAEFISKEREKGESRIRMERRGVEGLEKGRARRERESQYINHHNRFRAVRYVYPNRRIAVIYSKLADLNQSAVTSLLRNSRHFYATMQVTGEHRGARNPGAGPRWLAEARRERAFGHCETAAAFTSVRH